ncbi:tRNA (guanine(9)-N(1))-methyltransferase [Blastocladiella emersonii ATCC 22665]|nr:tRNA (guanine(9)-N(1))-methyltransferase [Blastocladiella emersonii ATCC 22665]
MQNAPETAPAADAAASAPAAAASTVPPYGYINGGSDFVELTPEQLATLSKNARKRYNRELKWHLGTPTRIAKRKVERKLAKERRRERIAAARLAANPPTRRPRVHPNREPSGVNVIIDLNFENLMSLKESKSLCKQLMFCYSANRSHAKSVNLVGAGMSPDLEAVMLSQVPAFRNWDQFPIHADPYTALPGVDKTDIVYLTGDSPNVLTTLEPGTHYVIGGLVDHNREKNFCYNRAVADGVRHAQLPIAEYIALKSRRILAVNHCLEIMVKVLENGGDWAAAFHGVIPQRKVEKDAAKDAKKEARAKRAAERAAKKANGEEVSDSDENDSDDDSDDGDFCLVPAKRGQPPASDSDEDSDSESEAESAPAVAVKEEPAVAVKQEVAEEEEAKPKKAKKEKKEKKERKAKKHKKE